MAHPETYKAAVVVAKGEPFQIQDIEWKDPTEHQIVVKVLACGVCHSYVSLSLEYLVRFSIFSN